MVRHINSHARCNNSQGLLWETSLLDPEEGIRLRGYSLPELQVCVRVCVTAELQLVNTHETLSVNCHSMP